MSIGTVWINGEPAVGVIPVTDSSVLRGDGCFEVLRSFDGVAFGINRHLERLARSALRLEIELPPLEAISEWIKSAAAERPSGVVRVLATRGSGLPGQTPSPVVIVFAHDWDEPPRNARLLPVSAPWHSAGAEWDLAGVKMLSYAPNMAASRKARAAGFDDALLIGRDGQVLEGPTFSIGWVRDGSFMTPTLTLGILGSVTRSYVLDIAETLGIDISEGRWSLDELGKADEVMAMSTIRRVQPVTAVGDLSFEAGPVTGRLRSALDQTSRSES